MPFYDRHIRRRALPILSISPSVYMYQIVPKFRTVYRVAFPRLISHFTTAIQFDTADSPHVIVPALSWYRTIWPMFAVVAPDALRDDVRLHLHGGTLPSRLDGPVPRGAG